MRKLWVIAVLAVVFSFSAAANAQVFNVSLSGANNTDGAGNCGGSLGDPDGTGSGTVTIDTVTNTVSWNITYSNLATVGDSHIHVGNFNQNGGVVVPFGTAPGAVSGQRSMALGTPSLSQSTGFSGSNLITFIS